jgi:hypothetical protein
VSGVFATNPREAPGAVTFRESIYMGETDLTPAQVQSLVQQMGQQYKGNSYHLLQTNCERAPWLRGGGGRQGSPGELRDPGLSASARILRAAAGDAG